MCENICRVYDKFDKDWIPTFVGMTGVLPRLQSLDSDFRWNDGLLFLLFCLFAVVAVVVAVATIVVASVTV